MRLTALLLLVACGGAPDDTDATCAPAMPSLTWAQVHSGYEEREALYTVPWSGEERSIPVNLWYPTDATSGEGYTYFGVFDDDQALVGAPFGDRDPDCKLPLVVYSHGYQGWGSNLSPFLRFLTSQGWVAASPDHIGNTLTTNEEPVRAPFSLTRTNDISATIDAIEALPPGHPLYDRVDTSNVVVLGHSFGGETAWLFSGPTFDTAAVAGRCTDCTADELAAFDSPVDDERVVAVVGLDGSAGTGLVAEAGWSTASRPILSLTQTQDGLGTFGLAHEADVTWAQFEGACHESFTGTALPCDGLGKEEGFGIIYPYLGAFLAQQQLGLDGGAGILDGSEVVSDRVTLQRTR